MSDNEYDWKANVSDGTKYFKKLTSIDEKFRGIQYTSPSKSSDWMSYEFCDFMCDDIQLVSLGKDTKVIIVSAGSRFYDYVFKEYNRDYTKTLYLFESDWLMLNENSGELFVVRDSELKNQYMEVQKS